MRVKSRHGVLTVNRTAIVQYTLIYLMIQYIGGRVLSALGSDIFFGGTIALCGFLMLLMPKRLPLRKDVFGYLTILVFSLATSIVITGGNLSIGTLLSIISRFLLVYIAVQYDSLNFVNRFLKLVYLMACISLIEFTFVQIVGEARALGLFSHLYEIENSPWYLGSSYGLFFICYNFMDAGRNAYMFGEPGEYQMLMIVALYFLTFYNTDLENKKVRRYYIVFLITLLTIQSTTGFFNLLAFLVMVLMMKRKQINPFIKRLLMVFVVAAIVYMLFFYTKDSFLYRNFFDKITSDDNTLDLAVNTGAARMGPILRFWDTVTTVPHKLIFGVGFGGMEKLPFGAYSTCGLLNSIVMAGVISSGLIYGSLFTSIYRSAKGAPQFAFVVFLVINMGLSQPDILSIMSVLICMYGTYSKRNIKEVTETKYEYEY